MECGGRRCVPIGDCGLCCSHSRGPGVPSRPTCHRWTRRRRGGSPTAPFPVHPLPRAALNSPAASPAVAAQAVQPAVGSRRRLAASPRRAEAAVAAAVPAAAASRRLPSHRAVPSRAASSKVAPQGRHRAARPLASAVATTAGSASSAAKPRVGRLLGDRKTLRWARTCYTRAMGGHRV